MANTLIDDSLVSRKRSGSRRFNDRTAVLVVIVFALVWLVGWFWTATPVTDLGVGNNMTQSGLQERWVQGQVVVMVRHAERCDRSGNPCLGSTDGITVNGSHSALAVGAGLQQMGLENARVIASPLTRTRQTADFIMGRAVPTQNWIGDCDSGFKDAVLSHKKNSENLVLVTHSGCIDQFERKMGVRAGERSSDYTQAFFVKVDGRHTPKILGSLNAEQWNNLDIEQLN